MVQIGMCLAVITTLDIVHAIGLYCNPIISHP